MLLPFLGNMDMSDQLQHSQFNKFTPVLESTVPFGIRDRDFDRNGAIVWPIQGNPVRNERRSWVIEVNNN
jgi:hypothetical protein